MTRISAPAASLASILVALICLLAGCDLPGQPHREDRPVRADEIVDFDWLFQSNCSGCHGPNGKLGPAPPLNDAILMRIVSNDDLLRVITEGRPGTPMPAFAYAHGGPLNEAQVKALATGLKSRFQSPVDLKATLPAYRSDTKHGAPVSTEDIARGGQIFSRACAGCHGERGEGTDVAGAIAEPAFLGLITDQALRRLIITGRPDLGMPNFADSTGRDDDFRPLSSDEIDGLVALLGSWRQGAAPADKHGPATEEGEP